MGGVPHKGCPGRVHHGSTNRERVMTTLALVFLCLTAFALHHYSHTTAETRTGGVLGWLFLALWALLFLEALDGYWRQGDYSWSAGRRLMLLWLIPPYRLALSPYPAGTCMWLPGVGWQRRNRAFFERLDRAFSIPMLLMALLILPILAVELFWSELVENSLGVALALDLGTALIWLAFTVEFIVMSTVAQKKLHYVLRHWVNLAVILLPLLAFVRGFQVARLIRLGKLGKALKVYRLRGLGMRAWQGIVSLELLERLIRRDPESRLEHLQQILAEKEAEAQRLRNRINELREECQVPVEEEGGSIGQR
jgi:hypothetical protein